jgi:hypothetical protein
VSVASVHPPNAELSHHVPARERTVQPYVHPAQMRRKPLGSGVAATKTCGEGARRGGAARSTYATRNAVSALLISEGFKPLHAPGLPAPSVQAVPPSPCTMDRLAMDMFFQEKCRLP